MYVELITSRSWDKVTRMKFKGKLPSMSMPWAKSNGANKGVAMAVTRRRGCNKKYQGGVWGWAGIQKPDPWLGFYPGNRVLSTWAHTISRSEIDTSEDDIRYHQAKWNSNQTCPSSRYPKKASHAPHDSHSMHLYSEGYLKKHISVKQQTAEGSTRWKDNRNSLICSPAAYNSNGYIFHKALYNLKV